MKFNDLDDVNLFFAESLTSTLESYGLTVDEVGPDLSSTLRVYDDDLTVIESWFSSVIYVKSEGIDNIDILHPDTVNEDTAKHILDYLNKRFADVGEVVLQEV